MADQTKPSAAARHATDTIDMAIKGAQAYEREDLVERLRGARRLVSDSSTTIHVVGEFKQGKSSLINALLSAPVCPVDDDVATSVLTEVRYAKSVTADAVFEPTREDAGAGWTESITPSEIASYVSESGNPGNSRRIRKVTVGIDRPLLANGLVLVDTPGVGGLVSVSNAGTISSLPRSHAVLFVSDSSQELTESEVRFLRTVQELCPTVVFVMTKTDLYPHAARMLERDRQHLRRAGVDIPSLPVSSEVRALAARAQDKDLNIESGFPTLVSTLTDVVAHSGKIALAGAVTHILSAVAQIEVVARARLETLTHPEKAAEHVAALTEAKERADALRERTARWQAVLQDGFADITSEIDFDLRTRTRAVLTEAEASIDEGDPATNWEEFEAWLRQRLADEALASYAQFVKRAKDVAAAVAEHFEVGESEVVRAREVAAPVDVIDSIAVDSSFLDKQAKKPTMAVFQKSYMGFLMFTMLSTMTGMGLPLAFGLVPGYLMGRSGLKEERQRALDKRRSDAKTGIRRYVEEYNLRVGKDSRDAVRHVQRELRNAWSERVCELQRSATEALTAAQAAVKSGQSDSGARDRAAADLETLGTIRARVEDLSAHLERVRDATPTVVEVATPAGNRR